MQDFISIVVPVYNAEIYLEKCIESLINQTYKNIEIILVDDGSTDESPEICDRYAKSCSKIKVIHKMNGGSTSSRKAGVKAAKGKYIGFVDSDDWIDLDMFELLYKAAESSSADVVTSGRYIEMNGTTTIEHENMPEGVYTTKEERKFLLSNMIYYNNFLKRGIFTNLCEKLIRRELISNIILQLDDKLTNGEDAVCAFTCIINAETVCVSKSVSYHYCRREGSITNTLDPNYYLQLHLVYKFLSRIIAGHSMYEILLKQLNCFMLSMTIKGMDYYLNFSQNECCLPYYVFPTEKLKNNSKIALYGAGKVGKSFYIQFKADLNYKLNIWVDKNSEKYKSDNLPITNIESLKEAIFDYVIVAVQFEGLANKIKDELIDMGIPENKIVWNSPKTLMDTYITIS